MEYLRDCTKVRRVQIKDTFINAMECAYSIFGPYAFRRITGIPPAKKNPINVALFESWSVGLSELSVNEQRSLINRKEDVINIFVDTLKEHTYSSDINTAKYNSIKRRIETVNSIIAEVLGK